MSVENFVTKKFEFYDSFCLGLSVELKTKSVLKDFSLKIIEEFETVQGNNYEIFFDTIIDKVKKDNFESNSIIYLINLIRQKAFVPLCELNIDTKALTKSNDKLKEQGYCCG